MPKSGRTIVLTVAVVLMAVVDTPLRAGVSASGQDFTLIERGRYLANAADCAACHDDPYQYQPFAGGRPIETPFGVVVAPNITPDRETGIGSFTDAQFDDALRHGKRPDGKRLYPAMPFVYYTKMSRADVLAIRAYLNTVQPVHHAVVSDRLPFPFSVRASMSVWDWLYFSPGIFQPDPSKSAAWNRGAFLVQGPGHCAACHTPKGALGGDRTSEELQGYSIQRWFAPDLTSGAHTGLADWTPEDIVEYLKKGHNRFAAASGPMAEEVADSSSHLSAADLDAIATYLKDQRAETSPSTPVPAGNPAMVAGAAIYQDLCSACHKSDGTGVPYLIPNLAASTSVAARDPTTLIRVIVEGARSVATKEEPTAPAMPAFGWQLNDAEVAAVATYLGNSWNHAAPAITEHDVQSERSKLASER
jgi:mono/diheme cytochrome c family protein